MSYYDRHLIAYIICLIVFTWLYFHRVYHEQETSSYEFSCSPKYVLENLNLSQIYKIG